MGLRIRTAPRLLEYDDGRLDPNRQGHKGSYSCVGLGGVFYCLLFLVIIIVIIYWRGAHYGVCDNLLFFNRSKRKNERKTKKNVFIELKKSPCKFADVVLNIN